MLFFFLSIYSSLFGESKLCYLQFHALIFPSFVMHFSQICYKLLFVLCFYRALITPAAWWPLLCSLPSITAVTVSVTLAASNLSCFTLVPDESEGAPSSTLSLNFTGDVAGIYVLVLCVAFGAWFLATLICVIFTWYSLLLVCKRRESGSLLTCNCVIWGQHGVLLTCSEEKQFI